MTHRAFPLIGFVDQRFARRPPGRRQPRGVDAAAAAPFGA